MAGIRDQYQDIHSDGLPASLQGLYTTRYICQTFQAGLSGDLTDVYLWINRTALSPENDLTIEIRNVFSGHPGSTILATTTIPIANFETGTPTTYVQATFLVPAVVIAATSYAIVIHQVGGDATHCYDYHYGKNSGDVYANGQAGYSADSGGSWTMSSTKDLYFETYVEGITHTETIFSDAHIVAEDIQETILSDAIIAPPRETITSDAVIVAEIISNINNKVSFVQQILSNITNKVSFLKQITTDIANFVNFLNLSISDINNDVRIQKQIISDIINDVRFFKTDPTDFGFQSLGKEYIKVYIGAGAGVEPIDSLGRPSAIVDTIMIHKIIGGIATASFSLGIPYDSSRPTLQSIVQIKYDNYLLYKGYITSIMPTDSPEEIQIRCSDQYWLDNQSNVYFTVGYKPAFGGRIDTYYPSIAAGLSACGISFGIGNFMPQEIICFAKSKVDVIGELVRECGNYDFYYDENGNIQLWISGDGSIINLNRQKLGKNIELYDVISHRFTEDASDVVNQYRVHLGLGGIQNHDFISTSMNCAPAWDSSISQLAKPGGFYEYGFNYFPPETSQIFSEAFKKYRFNSALGDLESWSDVFPPEVMTQTPIGLSAFGNIVQFPEFMTSGFSIDYKNGIITFSSPQVLEVKNNYGEVVWLSSKTIRLHITKQRAFEYIENPNDPNNPLVFLTSVMGSGSILKTLELTQFTIQSGYTTLINGQIVYLSQPWTDIPFATDYANWQLSKVCDTKITANVDITLDAACFYNIKLNNRIYIDGITDSALNIESIDYNMSSFLVTLNLKNGRSYNRTVNYQWHG
jgi:hypothetical protein